MGYAGFWRRFVAALIDGLLLTIVYLVVIYLLRAQGWSFELEPRMVPDSQGIYRAVVPDDWSPLVKLELIALVINWLYVSIMLSCPMQATVGKIIMSIYVTDMRGKRIGFGRATVRFLASIVSSLLLLLGYFVMLFSSRRQTLHDMVAGTLVVHEFAPRSDIR